MLPVPMQEVRAIPRQSFQAFASLCTLAAMISYVIHQTPIMVLCHTCSFFGISHDWLISIQSYLHESNQRREILGMTAAMVSLILTGYLTRLSDRAEAFDKAPSLQASAWWFGLAVVDESFGFWLTIIVFYASVSTWIIRYFIKWKIHQKIDSWETVSDFYNVVIAPFYFILQPLRFLLDHKIVQKRVA